MNVRDGITKQIKLSLHALDERIFVGGSIEAFPFASVSQSGKSADIGIPEGGAGAQAYAGACLAALVRARE